MNEFCIIYCHAAHCPKIWWLRTAHMYYFIIPECQEAGLGQLVPLLQGPSQATAKALAGSTVLPASGGSCSTLTRWLSEGVTSLQAVGEGSAWTSGSCHMGLSNVAACTSRREHTGKTRVIIMDNLITEVTCHGFCCVWSVRTKSLGPGLILGRDDTRVSMPREGSLQILSEAAYHKCLLHRFEEVQNKTMSVKDRPYLLFTPPGLFFPLECPSPTPFWSFMFQLKCHCPQGAFTDY